MAQDRATPRSGASRPAYQKIIASSYYGLLGVHPSASVREIRQAYRDLSKVYHPDTTELPGEVATQKFQQLNEAYATLSNPERRTVYDQKIGYSRVAVVQPLSGLNYSSSQSRVSSSAYLDPTDRPLSAGEVFALFILGVTFLACLLLAIAIGLTRGEAVLQPTAQTLPVQQITLPEATSLPEPTVDSPQSNSPQRETHPGAALTASPDATPETTVSSSGAATSQTEKAAQALSDTSLPEAVAPEQDSTVSGAASAAATD